MKLVYRKHLTTAALTWSGCLLLFLFAYMFVLAPQNKSKKTVEKELADKKQQYQSTLKATEEETAAQLKKEIEDSQDKLKAFVVNFEDCGNLTFDIGRIANEIGITSFSIQSKDKGGILPIPNCNYLSENILDIRFTAEFKKLAAFLSALERHRPIIFIDGFTIAPSIQQEDLGQRVNLNVAVFVRKKQGG